MEQPIIAGVAADLNDAKITILGVPDRPGEAAAIFRTLAEAQVNIDMIVQNVSTATTGRTDVTFACPTGDVARALQALLDNQEVVGFERLTSDEGVAEDLPGRRRHAFPSGRLGHFLRGPVRG